MMGKFGSASMNQIHARLLSRHSLENPRKDSMIDVVNNKAQNRYELTVDGHLAATYYKVSDGVITFSIPKSRRNSAARVSAQGW